ncbi:hypothetical protein O3M35_001951 [Rhynocoris fuscipes]|uniref:ATPase AAA-type core domain-containing protein n=1 Tax=Rhynocoris fuscipes TaxID=488301 RepID=A0AAW1CPC0_9HEMI
MMNLRYIPVSDEEKLRAALIIQRHWARYKQKREAKFRITQKRLLYDVYTPSYRDLSHEKALEEVKESRRNRQIESLKALQDAAFVYKLRMERKKDLIQCDLEIELMDYIRNWYETTKQLDQPKLPEWPEEKEYSPTFNYFGLPKKIPSEVYAEEVEIHDVVNVFYGHWFKPLMGSEVITACHWVPPELWVHIKKVLDDLKNSKKKGDKDKSKGKEKEKARQAKLKKEAENQKKLAERKQIGYIPKDSAFLYDMIPASREAWIKYCHKSVTKYNRAQTEDKWLLESKIANDVHRDTRILADKQIRENLILLEMAIKKDKGKKKVKPPMEKKKKTPKPPKTPFDMTGDLESWQLFELMAKKMLIKTYTRTFFKNLIGEYSFNNYELRNIYFEDPPASIGDIYEVIKEYCVFPFANPTIRRTTKLIQSVLFLGPKFYTVPIINAICTETGSLMFNINTLDVADKFEDKKMLIHLLTKVPALFEPAVIYIEDIEKAFWKKVPEEDKEKNPRFIGPLLKKIISAIKQESRVLFLATSEKPWDAKKAKMMKLFTKIIPIPDLDYFTLSSYWRDKLFQQHSVQRQFDFTNLASISKGIKLEDIKGAIDVVMKPERICKLYVKPLKYEELEPFLPAPQADKSYWDWCKKNVPIFKKRTAMLRKEAKERREKEERERKMKKQLEKEKKRGKHK